MVAVLKNRKKVLNQVLRFLVCLLLCFLLLFNYSIREPVEAAPAVVVVGGVAVATVATLLGIGISAAVTNQSWEQECQTLWNNLIPDDIKQQVTVISLLGGAVKYKFTSDAFNKIASELIAHISSGGGLSQVSSLSQLAGFLGVSNSNCIYPFGFSNQFGGADISWFGQSGYKMVNFNIINKVTFTQEQADSNANNSATFTLKNNSLTYSFIKLNGSYGYYLLSHSGDSWKLSTSASSYFDAYMTTGCLISCTYGLKTDAVYASNGTVQTPESVRYYFSLLYIRQLQSGLYANSLNAVEVPYVDIGHDVINTDKDKFYAEGLSALNTELQNIEDRLRSIEGDIVGRVGANDVGQAREQTQAQTAEKDIADADSQERDKETNKDRDTSKPKPGDLPDLSLPQEIFMKKFPFCIPWDMYTSIKMMAAPAAAPKVDVPVLVIPKLGWNYSVTLDLSKPECSTLGAISRWGFYALFLFALMLLTRKVIWK